MINTSSYLQISHLQYRGRGCYPTRVGLLDCGDGSNGKSLDPSRQSIYPRTHHLCTQAQTPVPPHLAPCPTRAFDRNAKQDHTRLPPPSMAAHQPCTHLALCQPRICPQLDCDWFPAHRNQHIVVPADQPFKAIHTTRYDGASGLWGWIRMQVLDPSRQSIHLCVHHLCTRAQIYPPPPPLSVWPTWGQDRDTPQ